MINRKKKVKWYFLYWTCYLLIFTMVQGLTDHDFFTVFRNELFSLAPKMIFVWIVVEKLMNGFLFNKKFGRFIAIYISLMVVFAFCLRLIDNYIIIRHFLTHWTREPLLSIAPFLYNVIKLQFLLTIPFCVKLYRHLTINSNALQQVAPPAGEKAFLHIKCERRMVRLSFDDICYFEAQGNYLTAFTVTGTFKTYLSISELEDKLPGAMFARVHRSFIVALNKVESHTGSLVVIGNRKIPIGRSYIPKIRHCLL
jgi:LytTr DNA-binding domain